MGKIARSPDDGQSGNRASEASVPRAEIPDGGQWLPEVEFEGIDANYHADAENKPKNPIAAARERIERTAVDAGILLSESEAKLFATLLILMRQADDEAAVLRFNGQAHARFFRFIGKKVQTPDGQGILRQAFADRLAVEFLRSYPPEDVEPADEVLDG